MDESVEPATFMLNGLVMREDMFPRENISKITSRDFCLSTEDVIIQSYPRTGTTLTSEIVYLLCSNGDFQTAKQLTVVDRVPFLEHKGYSEVTSLEQIEATPPPRLIKSHLPYEHLKHVLEKQQMKIVYVMRNPKDNAVSRYHFDIIRGRGPVFKDDWHTYFKHLYISCPSKLYFGNYFDHVLGYWSNKGKVNIHFVKYEDILHDPVKTIRELSRFLGRPASDELIERIIEYVSFDKMQVNTKANYEFAPKSEFDFALGAFIRKGKVGNWKQYFNDEENEIMDKLYNEKLVPEGIIFDFE